MSHAFCHTSSVVGSLHPSLELRAYSNAGCVKMVMVHLFSCFSLPMRIVDNVIFNRTTLQLATTLPSLPVLFPPSSV